MFFDLLLHAEGTLGPRRTEMFTSQRRDPSLHVPSLTPR